CIRDSARIFGVTATPNRGDRKGLREVFDNVADQVRLGELIASWALAELRVLDAAEALRAIARHGPPTLAIIETQGDAAQAEALQERIETVACRPVPAVLIHPGPLRPPPRGRRRLILSRPFRPGRLRALLDHLLADADEAP
ncbi:MAG: hypothetical protein N2690_03965, partial [Rhodocyclaceae bacterium]|nr:hypothetical protein [Rhodocyclaceae bacterium]